MAPAAFNINDALPEEALCIILGYVDWSSKTAVLKTCKKWYRLLTYPPQGSGVWGTLPLNLVRLHTGRMNSTELEWLARRAAGVAGLNIYASTDVDPVPRSGVAPGGADSVARHDPMPYRLATGRHFTDFSLARLLGMLSPWLPPASVSVNLYGATFEHRSFTVLTSESQPWLAAALADLRFESNMMKAEERFPHLCGFTNLTRLECLAEPGGYSRQPCLKTLPTSIGLLTQLRTLRLDLHAESAGLPTAASALQALRTLDLRAGPKFDADVLASLARLLDLSLSLGKLAPPGPPRHIDEERLASALAHLTGLTQLQLTDCGLGAIPSEVLGMRALVDLDLSRNQLWRCGGPPLPPAAPDLAAGHDAGPNYAPIMGQHLAAQLQAQHVQQAHQNAQQIAQQIVQQHNAGGQQPNAQAAGGAAAAAAAAAAPPPGEAAQPGGDGGWAQGADAQGANAPGGNGQGDNAPAGAGANIYQTMQNAHAAAANEARLMTAHARQSATAARAAAAGHGWWPAGLADGLQGLTRLALGKCSVKALPPELSRLGALRELHLPHNLLGGDGRVAAMPALPKLLALDVSYNGYCALPPGLLQLGALTHLRFCDAATRALPPLEPLLQMSSLQQVNLLSGAMAHRNLGGNPNIIRAGAFEAKFVALRQGRPEAQPAPSAQAGPALQGAAQPSTFAQLGVVEEPQLHQGATGGYPRDYMLPGHLLPPGHPGGPHLHMFDPIDDGEDDEDDYDEDDDEDEMMEWAEDAGWGNAGPAGPHGFDPWHPHPPPPIF